MSPLVLLQTGKVDATREVFFFFFCNFCSKRLLFCNLITPSAHFSVAFVGATTSASSGEICHYAYCTQRRGPHSPGPLLKPEFPIDIMNSATIAVHWHDDGQPVYLVTMEPTSLLHRAARLATAGGDNNVRVWHVNYGAVENLDDTSVEYLSTLRKHTQAVNAVRFDPSGELLATAGDDGMLILWNRADHIISEFGHQDDDAKESWTVKLLHNTQLEIYDVCWSPDSRFIATGSMDNITKIFSVASGHKLCELADHSHYVQGVAWDPLNEFLATQGADRTLHIYSLKASGDDALLLVPTLFFKVIRAEVPVSKLLLSGYTLSGLATETVLSSTEASPRSPPAALNMSPPLQKHVHHVVASPKRKMLPSESLAAVNQSTGQAINKLKRSSLLYHSETLQSFFRRLSFSPDGLLLLTPLGIYKNETNTNKEGLEATHLNTVYIYIRSGLNRPPVCHLPGLPKPAVAIAFNPMYFKLSTSCYPPVFDLAYKMVFAVATQDSVYVYDTQSLRPLAALTNLHYLTITDLCWDFDGHSIIVSSAEGFCSVIAFEQGRFGTAYDKVQLTKKSENANTSVSTEPKSDLGADVIGQLSKQRENVVGSREISAGNNAIDLLCDNNVTLQPTALVAHPAGIDNSRLTKTTQIAKDDAATDKFTSSPETVDVVDKSPAHNITQVAKPSTGMMPNVEQKSVTPSLLSQFIADPVITVNTSGPAKATIVVDDESVASKPNPEKKRRIAPTLITE